MNFYPFRAAPNADDIIAVLWRNDYWIVPNKRVQFIINQKYK